MGREHDAYTESLEEYLQEGGGEPDKDYFLYIKKYKRDAGISYQEDLDCLRDAYFEEHSTTRRQIFQDSKRELQEVAEGVGLGALSIGSIVSDLLGWTPGTLELGIGAGAASAVKTYSGARNLHREHGPEDVKEGLKYLKENRSLPPSKQDVKRWEGMQRHIDIFEGEEIDRYLGDLPELLGDDLGDVDIDDLGTLRSEDTDEGCEIRVMLYYGTLHDDGTDHGGGIEELYRQQIGPEAANGVAAALGGSP